MIFLSDALSRIGLIGKLFFFFPERKTTLLLAHQEKKKNEGKGNKKIPFLSYSEQRYFPFK